jgi:hypothetical protein
VPGRFRNALANSRLGGGRLGLGSREGLIGRTRNAIGNIGGGGGRNPAAVSAALGQIAQTSAAGAMAKSAPQPVMQPMPPPQNQPMAGPQAMAAGPPAPSPQAMAGGQAPPPAAMGGAPNPAMQQRPQMMAQGPKRRRPLFG